jgi:hypothetical protein
MEPVIRKFSSHSEADADDEESDIQLSPGERLLMVMQLREQYYGDAVHQRLDRVYRVVKRGAS